jgi:hypothetical protein
MPQTPAQAHSLQSLARPRQPLATLCLGKAHGQLDVLEQRHGRAQAHVLAT